MWKLVGKRLIAQMCLALIMLCPCILTRNLGHTNNGKDKTVTWSTLLEGRGPGGSNHSLLARIGVTAQCAEHVTAVRQGLKEKYLWAITSKWLLF